MTRCKTFLISILFLLLSTFTFAQQNIISNHFLMNETNGFITLEETSNSIVLYNEENDITIICKMTDKSFYNSSEDFMIESLEKISTVNQEAPFVWNNRECAFGTFEMNMSTTYSGLALTTPTYDKSNYLLFLGYAPSQNNSFSQSIIMSCLNSICLDWSEYYTPGPVTTFAYPLLEDKKITLNIDGKNITSYINEADEEAAQFLIEMEYTILRLQKYASDEERIQAWKRYYSLIYRDNYGRIENVINDVLKAFYPKTCRPDKKDEIVFAQKILSWVQTFQYNRAATQAESDFTSLPAVLCGTGNDCDSRSMLVCAFMQKLKIDSVLLISPAFSHALAGIDIMAPGQMFMFDNTNYLLGETTAKITWGTIVKDHADQSKWFAVHLDLNLPDTTN